MIRIWEDNWIKSIPEYRNIFLPTAKSFKILNKIIIAKYKYL